MSSQPVTLNTESCNVAISRNPATDELIAAYAFQTADEVESLLAENNAAFRLWRATPMSERVEAYRRLSHILRERSESLAGIITAEMGKTLTAARAEVEKCAATLNWIASNGPAILADEPVSVENDDQVHVSYLPIGSILAVMPWNFPLWQVIRASGPIMLSGNAFILKHAPNVMGSAYALQDAYESAGFPKGLFTNLIADNDMVAEVIADDRVAAVTLTGSMRAGSAVSAIAGKALKKSLLELGGSDAFIVLADANIDLAVTAAVEARFQNAGQVCLAAKRFILEKPIAEEFTQKFIAAVQQLKVGDPLDPQNRVGPMARKDLRDELHNQVERTLAAGATLLLGGKKMEGSGNFYAPTVLGDVAPGMAAFDEETFGPVAAITIADNVEHAIELANTSDYGLGGNLWTEDISRGQRIARRLETGGVFINGFSATNARIPVGGVKKSGYGRELSHFGLREFTNPQAVWAKKVS
ncbi:MAG: NAD-dependent succinate-semialdehyde dehydrogenase [Ewingella americana]|jgi:succinate-semialdehyde dehydrogenase|nr:NAD-dependent succinate-semialdehyde dehydrogenase [Ewingella americana]MCI1678169.1 NAD-dependent succinate-semialdehyde dehydrogenase [Ewingella americana]MCI1856194.1 NAD-dependent succinate-semialdehyde dehydrogenase [Ewingella americana]MCI1862419.1 NAD-dependent succinate-semialdehyde dehydrogenase [Ewingella americana]MCI2162419.1 NAD-dependent succinate-semialdehyde dehydrogenase [Ewingella americana]MCI2209132.1 NAD-dependent succinate-semialdehyde dehydrogenase [Ewingella american